jgi:hypothetical protein
MDVVVAAQMDGQQASGASVDKIACMLAEPTSCMIEGAP